MNVPTSLYLEIISNVPIACVDIAIVYHGKILLVKRDDKPAKNQWWLPGGRIYKGEMMKDAAKRKALEEVGIECRVGPIIHTAETIFPDGPHNVSVHSINSCFILYPVNIPVIKLDIHHKEFVWINSIPNNSHPYIVNCLEKAGFEMSYIHVNFL